MFVVRISNLKAACVLGSAVVATGLAYVAGCSSTAATDTISYSPITSLIANATGDGLRNEYVYRRLIHDMLAQDPSITLEALNARVYTELFLTPASDPWLGMRADDVWDAIDRLGMP